MRFNSMVEAHQFLVRRISYACNEGFLPWGMVNTRMKGLIMESGSDCGRYMIVKVGEYFFRIDDAGHNSYIIYCDVPKSDWLDRDILKVVANALHDGCKVRVTCDGEVDCDWATHYSQVITALNATDDIVNIELMKRKYKGCFSTSLDLDDDESIMDYTANDYCNKLSAV